MQYFVRIGALSGFVELVSGMGADPISILNECDILPSQLNDPDNMIPYEKLGEVLERAANYLGMPDIGAQLSTRQGLSAAGLLGVYMAQQPTIAAALSCAAKFAYMHAQGVFIEIQSIDQTLSKLTMNLSVNSQKQYPQLVQLSIGIVYQSIKEMMGEAWHANTITLEQMQSHSLQARLEQIFHCQVAFGQLEDSIIFPSEVLKRKPIHSDHLLNEVIGKQFMQMHSNTPDTLTLIHHAINMLLPTGDCSKENIALSLNMHPKKLERILIEEGLSYRQVLENTRRTLAVNSLKRNDTNLTTLALNLGYSEFSAFSRSFKRWFGVSPSRYK